MTKNNKKTTLNKIYEKYRDAIVPITHSDPKTFQNVPGSGFFYKYNGKYYIITTADNIIDFTNFDSVNNRYNIYNDISIGIFNINNTGENITFSTVEGTITNDNIVGMDGAGNTIVLHFNVITNQKHFKFGDSHKAERGEYIYLIGTSPFTDKGGQNIFSGIDYFSTAKGVIKNNKFVFASPYPELILIDINADPGTPILDKCGRVLGMIAVNSSDQYVFGPSQYIMEHVVKTIIKTNSNYVKGYIGVLWSGLSVNEYFPQGNTTMKYAEMLGINVDGVDQLSPAWNYFGTDDILLTLNEVKLGTLPYQHSIGYVTWFKKPGDMVTVNFLSASDGYNKKTVTFALGSYTPINDTPMLNLSYN